MPIPCIHEGDFGSFKTMFKAINKVLFDNGTKGLQTQVVELNINLKNRLAADSEFRESLEAVNEKLIAINTFIIESKKETKVTHSIEHNREQTKQAEEKTKQFRIGIIITSIFSVSIVVLGILNYIKV